MGIQETRKQLIEQIEQLLDEQNDALLSNVIADMRPSDIAEVVELIDNDHRHTIFNCLDDETAAEVLQKVDEATRGQIYELFGSERFAQLVSLMPTDEAADVLAELDREDIAEVHELLPDEVATEVSDLMKYSEDTAGGIMDPVMVSVHQKATVAQAVEEIRAADIDEDFYTIFVVNDEGKFLGDVRIRQLITAPADTPINKFVDKDCIYVSVNADQEEVRNIFHKNDLIVVPVLDLNNKLVGRITADRILEVAQEEANEDIYAMAGTDTAELEKESVFRAARIRMTWLVPCMLGTAVTALVGMIFRETFSDANQLYLWAAAFVFTPMIAAISGNAGLQTSAIVVSGLAAGHLADLRLREVFEREFRIAVLVALCCGILGAAVCAFLPQILPDAMQPDAGRAVDLASHIRIVIAFGVGMFSAIVVSTTLGLFLPFLFKSIGIDPAISAGPLVTTANDSISVTIYMTLTLLLLS